MRVSSVAISGQEQVPGRFRGNGFTLIELSVVIGIIALITAAGISMGSSMVDSARRTATNNRLDAIENALYAYRMANERLPCPTDASLATSNANYGIEAANKGVCTGGTPTANYSYTIPKGGTTLVAANTTVTEGAVPVKTLNLPAEFMYDAWGRKFAYAVWTPITAENAFVTNGIAPSCGGMTIENAGHGNRATSNLYTLVSYGPDGNGGYTQNSGTTRYNGGVSNADELTNCHCTSTGADNGSYTATYIQKAMSLDASDTKNPFQHIVRFKARWQMQNAYDTYAPTGQSCVPGFVIDGAGDAKYSGSSIAIADINGDGIPDLIIGAPWTNNFTGAVYVIFGTKSGFPDPLPLNTLNGSNGFELYGAASGGGAGISVAAGDINGDGVADIIIGAQGANSYAGSVYVVYGGVKRKDGTNWTSCPCTLNTGFLNGVNGVEFDGSLAWSSTGNAVATGNVRGTGTTDLIIGAPGASSVGSIYVVYGNKAGWSSPTTLNYNFLNGANGVEFDGGSSAFGLGASLAAGDINDDGIPDIISGAGYGPADANVAFAIFGKNPLLPQTTITTTSTSSPAANVGSAAGLATCQVISSSCTSAGTTISTCGGTSTCGTACTSTSIVLSANASATCSSPLPMNVVGQPLSASFLNGTNGVQFNGPAASGSGWSNGTSVAAGDVNGDGIADLIVGNSAATPGSAQFAGSVYVVFGKRSGWPTTATTLNSSFLNGIHGVEIDGSTANEDIGLGVAAGDVNGDTVADVIIGSATASAYLLFGKNPLLPQTTVTTTNGSPTATVASANGLIVGDTVSASTLPTGTTIAGISGTTITLSTGSGVTAGTNVAMYVNAIPVNSGFFSGTYGVQFTTSIGGGNGGYMLPASGDINGDGIADLIIGEPDANLPSGGQVGATFVYFGKKTGWPTSPYDLGGL